MYAIVYIETTGGSIVNIVFIPGLVGLPLSLSYIILKQNTEWLDLLKILHLNTPRKCVNDVIYFQSYITVIGH